MTTFLYIVLILVFALFALLVFGMAEAAGRYDEISERIYQKEIEKLERSLKLMEEAEENSEYIAPEDK
jgi:hypothetical protein